MSTIADLQSTATSSRLNNIREHVISAVNWCGRQVSEGGKFLSNLTTKVALVFANLKKNPIDFAKNNKTFTAVTVLLAIGTISFLAVKLAKVCLNSKKPVEPTTPPASSSAAAVPSGPSGPVQPIVAKIEAQTAAEQEAAAKEKKFSRHSSPQKNDPLQLVGDSGLGVSEAASSAASSSVVPEEQKAEQELENL